MKIETRRCFKGTISLLPSFIIGMDDGGWWITIGWLKWYLLFIHNKKAALP